jgi:hypothetical protein
MGWGELRKALRSIRVAAVERLSPRVSSAREASGCWGPRLVGWGPKIIVVDDLMMETMKSGASALVLGSFIALRLNRWHLDV